MKGISILLSFIFLFQSVGVKLHDILQLDAFIEHAQFHNQQYGDNFFVFVSKHYGELKSDHNTRHQEEKKDHDQLPFQHHRHASSVAVLSLVSPHTLEIRTLEFLDFKPHRFFYQELSSSSYPEGLFQPPRII
ncbi:hypothetical protein [Psychroserpens mesophilus]|uniref:hypothetical protein n=1 Tax=Psychroserpens mesophilus TaxID=325473 RepID=UPI003D65B726